MKTIESNRSSPTFEAAAIQTVVPTASPSLPGAAASQHDEPPAPPGDGIGEGYTTTRLGDDARIAVILQTSAVERRRPGGFVEETRAMPQVCAALSRSIPSWVVDRKEVI